VPEIIPVDALRVSPAGKEGEMEYVTTAPPDEEGSILLIATFLVARWEFGLYLRFVGGMSMTDSVKLPVVEPPPLVAVIVYCLAGDDSTVGVPLITPVASFKIIPAGKTGVIEYFLGLPAV
jgi:hypothetical protein